LDLLGRKILLQKLKPINEHCALLRSEALALASSGGALGAHARSLLFHALEWQYLTYKVGYNASKNKETVGSSSVDYLMYSGYIELARHWLKMEAVAQKALSSGEGRQERGFYEAKIATSAFVFDNILPRTRGLKASMFTPLESVMGLHHSQFSYDYGAHEIDELKLK